MYIDKALDKLGLVIQKHDEIFDQIVENQKNKYEILPDEITIILLLYRKIAEKLDAIFILIENKSEKTAESICRDLFENYIYLRYVIDPNGSVNLRALSYYYSTLKDQVSLAELMLSERKNGKKVREFMNLENNEEFNEEILKRKEHFLTRMDGEKFRNIKLEWNYLVKKKRIHYPKWYSLFKGPKNIRELAQRYDLDAEYETMYRIFSNQVHSNNAMQQIENIKGLAGIKNLRVYDDPSLVLIFTRGIGIYSLTEIVNYFGLQKTVDIKKWYINHIR